MKSTAMIAFIILLGSVFVGCAGVEVKPVSTEDMVWGSANLLGFHAIQKYEDYAIKAERIAKEIQAMPETESYGDKINPLVLELTFHLSKETDLDPMIVHGLTLLLPMIQVKPGPIPARHKRIIESAMNGYLAGVDSGRKFAMRQQEEESKLAMQKLH